MFSEFQQQRPPIFQGEVVAEWIHQIKRMLETMGIDNVADRVALATYQLEGEADRWWTRIKESQNIASITWAQFEEMFLEKYLPNIIREDKVRQFLSLRQKGLSVTQYVAKFEELLHHVPRLVTSDEDKARKWECGLDFSLKEKIIPMRLPTYQGVINAAVDAEKEKTYERKVLSQKKSGTLPRGGPVRNTKNFVAPKPYVKPFQKQPQQQVHRSQLIETPQTRKMKNAARPANPIMCYHCRHAGHIRSMCPQLTSNPFRQQSQKKVVMENLGFKNQSGMVG